MIIISHIHIKSKYSGQWVTNELKMMIYFRPDESGKLLIMQNVGFLRMKDYIC